MEGIYVLFGAGILVAFVFGFIVINQNRKEKHSKHKP